MARWTWTYAQADGSDVPPPPGDGRRVRPRQPTEGFSARVDAETWIGESWRALVASGVQTATLHRDGARTGAPLALAPPG